MAKKIHYDAALVEEFASRLYSHADSVVATYTMIGLVVGAGLAYAALHELGVGVAIAAVIAGAIGYGLAQPRAFLLRLQAQQALCQVQIERNTRPPTTGAAP